MENQEVQENKMKPFLGWFNLSKAERIIHSILIFLISSAYFGYEISTQISSEKDLIDNAVELDLSVFMFAVLFLLFFELFYSAIKNHIDEQNRTTRALLRRILYVFVSYFLYVKAIALFAVLIIINRS